MPAHADEIGNDPVLLPLLNPPELQRQQLSPPKPTPEEHREHRVIAELARCGRCPLRHQSTSLLRREPVQALRADIPCLNLPDTAKNAVPKCSMEMVTSYLFAQPDRSCWSKYRL